MKKVIFIVVLLSVFTFCNLNSEELTKGVGFTAGQLSGIGFNYRQYFDKNGMQFTFGFISTSDKAPKFTDSYTNTKTGWEINGWLSAMYLRTIRDSDNSRFYFFAGTSINIDRKDVYVQDNSGTVVKTTKNHDKVYFGPGLGIELKASKYFSLLFELPVSISDNKKIVSYIPQGGFIIKF